MQNTLKTTASSAARPFPTEPGTYLLLMYAPAPDSCLLGRFGTVRLTRGYYLYVGSALGPGGLRSRLAHHLRPAKRPHWHVDYLRQRLDITAVWFGVHRERQECLWARTLATWRGARIPFPGFGASDCACDSHLLYLGYRPSRQTFQHQLRKAGIHPPRVKVVRVKS